MPCPCIANFLLRVCVLALAPTLPSPVLTRRLLLVLLPLGGATTIAVTRVVDYHHSRSDIIAGALIGSIFALLSYSLYWPPLWSTRSGFPKGIAARSAVATGGASVNRSRASSLSSGDGPADASWPEDEHRPLVEP